MKYSAVDGLIDRDGNGGFYISPRGLALIFGVSESQVRKAVDKSGGPRSPGEVFSTSLPYIWIQNGRRRIREAFAVVGEEDMGVALAYLDRLEGGVS